MKNRELILVVDDSSTIRERMKSILIENGYDVILRNDGQAGVMAALEYSPDLIIMDLNMPGMNGLEASAILKRYPQTSLIPLAVFTDDNKTENKVAFFEAGVEDFIVKDSDEAEVLARVAGLLRWGRNRNMIIDEKSKLGTLIDILSDLVLIVNREGLLVFYNRIAALRFRLIPELINQISIKDVLPDSKHVRELCDHIENGREATGMEIEINNGGIDIRHYIVDISRVRIDMEEDVGGAIVFRDITAEKEAEKLKSEFYSMMAHEMRTPISVVLGYTQLILEGKTGELTDLQEEFLRGVEDKGKALKKLVNDFLEVSRFENKFVRLHNVDFNVAELVSNTVTGIKLLAQNKNITLEYENNPARLVINADKDKLEQVIINLVENAIKYTDEGGTVSVRCGRLDEGVCVAIEDNGIGMSPEELEIIFERFKRLDNAEKKKIKGTGLGLAIVKEIIDAHNGRIEVESIEGKGSSFSLWIPGARDSEIVQSDVPVEIEA
ncbi:MAG: response regulator [Candidatus Krumholzibacteriota bacterium]|nr:response regulator [Candidatus Krumholzibacteriota bacterium]